MIRASREFLVSAFVALAVLSSGCLNDTRIVSPGSPETASSSARLSTAPSTAFATPEPGFFPLALGNRWHIRFHRIGQYLGQGEPPRTYVELSARSDQVVACEHFLGEDRHAFIRSTNTRSDGSSTTWTRYRQDREGLWRWIGGGEAVGCDDNAAVNPSVASADDITRAQTEAALRDHPRREAIEKGIASLMRKRDALEGEHDPRFTLELPYPLHIGTTWQGGANTYRVDAREVLEMPFGKVSAWRIRKTYAGLGPNDRVYTFVSRLGYLKSVMHLEEEVTEGPGVTPGIPTLVTLDELSLLESVELAGTDRAPLARTMSERVADPIGRTSADRR